MNQQSTVDTTNTAVNTSREFRTVEDLIRRSEAIDGKGGRSKQYLLSGGFEEANREFDALRLNNVKEITTQKYGKGRMGYLPDGSKVIVRAGSSTRERMNNFSHVPATLEIQSEQNGELQYVKFRFKE